MKKNAMLLFLFLFLSVIVLSGCGTAKGAAEGVGSIAKGAADDVKGTSNGLKKADDWVKKNAW